MPRPRPKFDDQKHYLKGVKYTPFNEDEYITNTLLELHCGNDKEHKYVLSIGEIKRKNIDPRDCPHCVKKKKYDNLRKENGYPRSLFEKIAVDNDFTFVNKEEYYTKNEDILYFSCNKCQKHKRFVLPKYVVANRKFKCDAKCETRVRIKELKRKEKEFKTKFEKTLIENECDISNIKKENIVVLQKYGWRVLRYHNSRTKSEFQCLTCGYKRESLIQNVLSYCKKNDRKGCMGCEKKRQVGEVENKIKKLCEKNDLIILSESYNGLEEELEFGCLKCGNEFVYTNRKINGNYGNMNCPKCSKSKRGEQTELYEYIKSKYEGEMVHEEMKVINPLQIDIYLPDEKIAFEYCGTIWHSSKHIDDANYHKKKLEACNSEGIRLITIFSDEWKLKNDICKKRIDNILGVVDKRIYARKTEVRVIDNREALKFCEENHIQGKGQAYISYGLYNENELVSVMTFSKPMVVKNGKGYDYELNRFCSKYNIVGGASKLLKAFSRDNPNNTIVSFCDLRWGTGVVYEKLGFKEMGTTRPNYYYVGNKTNWERKHRFGFTKKSLKDRFGCDVVGTEKEMATAIGLYQIYDCGHKKYKIET